MEFEHITQIIILITTVSIIFLNNIDNRELRETFSNKKVL